jgi:GGDEF domain-containing protein
MNWVFVFDADNFKRINGFNPEFPDDFNVARY